VKGVRPHSTQYLLEPPYKNKIPLQATPLSRAVSGSFSPLWRLSRLHSTGKLSPPHHAFPTSKTKVYSATPLQLKTALFHFYTTTKRPTTSARLRTWSSLLSSMFVPATLAPRAWALLGHVCGDLSADRSLSHPDAWSLGMAPSEKPAY